MSGSLQYRGPDTQASKNDIFYVYGKFRTIRMKIIEVTTPLAILDYFLPGVF